MEARSSEMTYLENWEKTGNQELHTAKLSFKSKGEIKTFSDN